MLLNFHWLCLISGHFFLFNFIFMPQIEPCVGTYLFYKFIGHHNGNEWGSTNALFNDHTGFIAPYAIVFGMQVFFFVCYMIVVAKNDEMTPKYNKLLNTLTIFGSVLVVFWLMVRFGIILKTDYYPAYILSLLL